jgi:hypothetical protein
VSKVSRVCPIRAYKVSRVYKAIRVYKVYKEIRVLKVYKVSKVFRVCRVSLQELLFLPKHLHQQM